MYSFPKTKTFIYSHFIEVGKFALTYITTNTTIEKIKQKCSVVYQEVMKANNAENLRCIKL